LVAGAAVALASGNDFDYKSPPGHSRSGGRGPPARHGQDAPAPKRAASRRWRHQLLEYRAMLRKSSGFLVVSLALMIGCSRPALAAPVFDAEQIKAILHTATVEENGFVTWVVTMVNQGIFPADLFESTLIWAQKKPARNRFEYFKQALILRAAAVGIDLSHGPPPQKPLQRKH
jgi:hypothetical protein